MEKRTMGTFLAALRRAKGMTQQEVADCLAVSNRAVSRWERDDTVPDITLLPAIADLFEVTVDELLRGERRRGADRSVSDHPSAGRMSTGRMSAGQSDTTERTETADRPADTAEAGTAPCPTPLRERVPRPDTRALRGMRAMARRARTQFDSGILSAVGLVAAGFVCQLGITYGLDRAYVGFAVFCLFGVGSVVLSLLAAARFRDMLNEQAPEPTGEDTCRLPDGDLCELVGIFIRRTYAAIAVPVCGTVPALPLVICKKDHYVGQAFMMDWHDYLLTACLLSLASALLGWVTYRPYCAARWRTWGERLELSVPADARRPGAEAVRRLTVRQSIAAAIGLGGGIGANLLVMSCISSEVNTSTVDVIRLLFGVLIPAGVVVPAVMPVRAVRRLPVGDGSVRRHVLVAGVRNAAVILLCSVFWSAGLIFVYTSGSYVPEITWGICDILAWLGGTLVLFAAAEWVRRRIR